MTVDYAIHEKKKVEEIIKNIIEDFERKTGLEVDNINYDKMKLGNLGGIDSVITTINIEVSL